MILTPGINLPVAEMLSCSFTKAESLVNQHKHKQLPPKIVFEILQDDTFKLD